MNAITQYRMFLAGLVVLRGTAPIGAPLPEASFMEALKYRRAFLDNVVPDLEGPIGEKVADDLARFTTENIAQLQYAVSATAANALLLTMGDSMRKLGQSLMLLSPEQFTVTDVRGRRMSAIASVQLALDFYANQRYIDSLLETAAEDPNARFTVSNSKPGHRFDGLRLTATELQARRFEIFHHGATSQVAIDG
jgi:hypothetical protein